MRIAFVTFEYPPFMIGGAGVYADKLTNELAKLGHDVVVFTPKVDRKTTKLFNGLTIAEVEVIHELPMVSVQFWLNLPNKIRIAHMENPFDVIHINGSSYWFILGKIIDIPHVVTIHHLSKDALSAHKEFSSLNSLVLGESNIFYQILEKRCVKFADQIIAVSNYTKSSIIAAYDLADDKVVTIYNGYEPLNFDNRADQINKFRHKFNLDSRPIILFVGRIDDPRKGLEILLESFVKVVKEIDCQLLIVGKGNRQRLMGRAKSLRIDTNIKYTGFLDSSDLSCSYSICDIYVCPSRMEGFGLTILEALSFNKKIIATKVGAIPEISDSSVDLIEPDNPKQLANSIVWALKNLVIKTNSNNDHLSNFSWSISAENTQKVYTKAIDKEQMITSPRK